MAVTQKWHLSDEDRAKIIDTLTQNLSVLRARAGISQSDLSHMVGISRQTYSAAEGKQRRLSWEACLALLLFFDCNSNTRPMLRSLGTYPAMLKERFNREGVKKAAKQHIPEGRQLLAALDAQALHTLRSVVLVEYARCTGLTDAELLRSELPKLAPELYTDE